MVDSCYHEVRTRGKHTYWELQDEGSNMVIMNYSVYWGTGAVCAKCYFSPLTLLYFAESFI